MQTDDTEKESKMKLATFNHQGRTCAGVIVGDTIVAAESLLQTSGPLADVRMLLEQEPHAIDRLRQAVAATGQAVHAGGISLSAVRLRAPVLQPPTIRDFMCYEGHATMGGKWQVSEAWYRLPIFYFSNPLCVFGTGDQIRHPATTKKFDFELEIAAIVGREGSNIPASEAMDYVAGFTILNDWSSRDLQRDEMAASLGPAKGKDSASSLGPWLVTKDELAPFMRERQLQLQCSLRVNGEEWVRGETGGMQHDWGDLVERASRDSRIVPGDVLGSGTITGGSVAEAIRLGFPARYLQPGDEVEVQVQGLGTLRNSIGEPLAWPAFYRYAAPTSSGKSA